MANFHCDFDSEYNSCPSSCDNKQWRYYNGSNSVQSFQDARNWILDSSIRISTGAKFVIKDFILQFLYSNCRRAFYNNFVLSMYQEIRISVKTDQLVWTKKLSIKALKFAILLYVKMNAQRILIAMDSILQRTVKMIVVVCTKQTIQLQRLDMAEEDIVRKQRVR